MFCDVICDLLIVFCVAGIALALFGGVRKHVMDKNKVPVRGDIHVIIVGTFHPLLSLYHSTHV
jgi:hypothetical protein